MTSNLCVLVCDCVSACMCCVCVGTSLCICIIVIFHDMKSWNFKRRSLPIKYQAAGFYRTWHR